MHLNRVKNKAISTDDVSLNFTEIEPDLTAMEAIEESNRCLYCYDEIGRASCRERV